MNDQKDDQPFMERQSTKTARALVLFGLGFAVFVNEAFLIDEVRIELVAVSLALMGLPAMLRLDEVRRNGNGNGNGTP